MVRNRTGLAPWSLSREAGIESATVDGTIEVPQYVQPTIDTGFVDEKGNWRGNKSSDKQFILYKDESIANGGTILAPTANADGSWPLDMTGFSDIIIAIKPTNSGSCAVTAVMGPASVSYANLNPVDAASNLKGSQPQYENFRTLFNDGSESMIADVWNIFIIQGNLKNQKLLQFKIVNNSGDISTIETGFMRIV